MTDRDRLRTMNEKIERLYREGEDHEARKLEQRADALARRIFRGASS